MKRNFMSRGSKIFAGFLSFLPIILVAALFIAMFLMFSQFNRFVEWQDSHPEPAEFFRMFGWIFVIEIIMFLVSIGVLIFFIINLSRNKKMDQTEKAVWVLALVLGNVICYPIYWYMKIWKEDI